MLFADIVGSTALTGKLDAETAHEVLYRVDTEPL
jgi:class 3 adenylate cyclase